MRSTFSVVDLDPDAGRLGGSEGTTVGQQAVTLSSNELTRDIAGGYGAKPAPDGL